MQEEKSSPQIKFETSWGGEDNWYTKSKRWATKQVPPVNFIALAIIEYLKIKWIDAKVEVTMQDVDRQAEEIKAQWEKEDELNRPKAEVVETGLFGEEGWSISISNPVVERRTEETDGRMGDRSDEMGLGEKFPDPWN